MGILKRSKEIALITIGACAGLVIKNAAGATTPPGLGPIGAVATGVGVFVLSMMVGEQASDYAGIQLDAGLTEVKKISDEVKQELNNN